MTGKSDISHAPYFYAGNEAAFYDDTVRLTDRAYDVIHEVTARVISDWLAEHHDTSLHPSSSCILDIGCGTGAEAMQLLIANPQCQILCIDNSDAMLEVFRTKLRRAYGCPTAGSRVALVQGDVRELGWLDRAVEACEGFRNGGHFSAVVSVYALHHLSAEIKGQVYRTIGERMPRGSVFVNADLYSFSNPYLARLAQREEEQWISRQFDVTNLGWLAASLGPSRVGLKEAWLRHVREENCPLPITVDCSDGRNTASEEHLLRTAGFRTISVLARLYQSAVVVAAK